MKKCWIIEQGCYSDYRVVGIFSTKENAEKQMARIKQDYEYDQPSIEERWLDPGIDELNQGLSQYIVGFDGDGASVRSASSVESDDCHWIKGSSYTVWAENDQAAIKIAAEKHAQYKASREGLL